MSTSLSCSHARGNLPLESDDPTPDWEAQLAAFLDHPHSQVNRTERNSKDIGLEKIKPKDSLKDLQSTDTRRAPDHEVDLTCQTVHESPSIEEAFKFCEGISYETKPMTELPLSLLDQKYAHRIVVLLVGPSGSGKTSFVSRVSGESDRPLPTNLGQGTMFMQVFDYVHDNVRYTLVDTPGFDDNYGAESVLCDLSIWLHEYFGDDRFIVSAVLYFHRITDGRFTGGALRGLQRFKTLCNVEYLKRTFMATTGWESLEGQAREIGDQREQELRATDEFWGSMIQQGSEILRVPTTTQATKDVLANLYANLSMSPFDTSVPLVTDMPIPTSSAGKNASISDIPLESESTQDIAISFESEYFEGTVPELPNIDQGDSTNLEETNVSSTSHEYSTTQDKKDRNPAKEKDMRSPQTTSFSRLTPKGSYKHRRRDRNATFSEKVFPRIDLLYQCPVTFRIDEPYNLVCNNCMGNVGQSKYYECHRCYRETFFGKFVLCSNCVDNAIHCDDPEHRLQCVKPTTHGLKCKVQTRDECTQMPYRCYRCEERVNILFLHCCLCEGPDWEDGVLIVCIRCVKKGRTCRDREHELITCLRYDKENAHEDLER